MNWATTCYDKVCCSLRVHMCVWHVCVCTCLCTHVSMCVCTCVYGMYACVYGMYTCVYACVYACVCRSALICCMGHYGKYFLFKCGKPYSRTMVYFHARYHLTPAVYNSWPWDVPHVLPSMQEEVKYWTSGDGHPVVWPGFKHEVDHFTRYHFLLSVCVCV